MEIIQVIIIAVVTYITRTINLLGIPIFTDEAIYIRWAQIGLLDPAHRYISLSDGKQPLLTWLMYPLLMIVKDPLIAGRLVSVFAGVFSAIGIYFLGKILFDKRVGLFASLIYVIAPFTLIYDRLALMDSLLSCLAVYSILLTTLLIKTARLDVSLLLGMTVGLGLLTKSSALFFLISAPASFLMFPLHQKFRIREIFKRISLFGISFVLAQIMYNSLRLSPLFYIIEQKNYSFVLTLSEFFSSPFRFFLPNLTGLVTILIEYLGIPLSIIISFGILQGLFKPDRKIIFLTVWFLIPFLSLAAFAKIIFPRFMLFMIIPLFIIAAKIVVGFYQFIALKQKKWLLVMPLLFIYSIYQSFLVIVLPVKAQIPRIDRNQLFDDWPSGYGVREVIIYLEQESKKSKIVVGTEGTFGLNPAVYEIYLSTNKNVEIYGFWPVSSVPEKLIEKAKQYPTYLIFKERQAIPKDWPLNLISEYRRGKGNTYLRFYQVDPTKITIENKN